MNFILAYHWDHHSDRLIKGYKSQLQRIRQRLKSLKFTHTNTPLHLLKYYSKLYSAHNEFFSIVNQIGMRQFVINNLAARGYGVNLDLLNALEGTKAEFSSEIYNDLNVFFDSRLSALKKYIQVSEATIKRRKIDTIIRGLCKHLKLRPYDYLNAPEDDFDIDYSKYEWFLGHINENTKEWIFKKMFLMSGQSSMTIMKGIVGFENPMDIRQIKLIANENFTNLLDELFSRLKNIVDIRLGTVKRIHYLLANNLSASPGEFRDADFADKNGVTFEHGNFAREICSLEDAIKETAEHFDDIKEYIRLASATYWLLLSIHPFWDSNGRVGKCFLNYLLLLKGLPPISFDYDSEVFALSRYGGSGEDMHRYIKQRIKASVDTLTIEYLKYLRLKPDKAKLIKIGFDSGAHFRLYKAKSWFIEVNFLAYIIADNDDLFDEYIRRSLVVFRDYDDMTQMKMFCGFSDTRTGMWTSKSAVTEGFVINYYCKQGDNVDVYDVTVTVEFENIGRFFGFSISSKDTYLYDNKGLNYSFYTGT